MGSAALAAARRHQAGSHLRAEFLGNAPRAQPSHFSVSRQFSTLFADVATIPIRAASSLRAATLKAWRWLLGAPFGGSNAQ